MTVKTVKSVARVMEILELFHREQRAMPAIEIAEMLNYPVASTHEILKTFVAFGYFTYGNPKWTYRPSHQFALVVDWVRDKLADDQELVELMETLNVETKETVNLSRRVGARVKIIKGLECKHPFGVSSKPGTVMGVTNSLTGISALSHMSVDARAQLIDSLKETDAQQYKEVDMGLLERIWEEIEQRGAAVRADTMISGIGAVCCPVISSFSDDDLVLGIVGPSDRIQENAIAIQKILRKAVKAHNIKTCYKVKT